MVGDSRSGESDSKDICTSFMEWFRSVCEEAKVNLKFCFQVNFGSTRTGLESVGNESREIADFSEMTSLLISNTLYGGYMLERNSRFFAGGLLNGDQSMQ